MQAPQELFERHRQELAEQAAAGERARVANVRRFCEMWMTLGQDCIRAASSQHRPEIDEALGLATHRWGRLLDMEAQVQRDEQVLAARPKTRPAQPGDEALPDRTLDQRNADWQVETKNRRAGLAELRKLAEKERRELESFTKGR
jgi:hypothetical protein